MEKLSYDRFFINYPKYKKYKDIPVIKQLFETMSEPRNISKLIYANDVMKKPALVGIVTEIEQLQPLGLDLTNDTIKQLVGSMVKEVLIDFGYENNKDMKLGNDVSRYFKNAKHYTLNPALAKLKLVVAYEITKI